MASVIANSLKYLEINIPSYHILFRGGFEYNIFELILDYEHILIFADSLYNRVLKRNE